MNTTKIGKRVSASAALALVLAFWATPVAKAELSPGSYDKLRIDAEEALVIEVASVAQKKTAKGGYDVTVKAKVLKAERSKAGLKKGTASRSGPST